MHLLGGTYQTRGANNGWHILTGQKILGSGMDVTTIKRIGTDDNTAVLGMQGGLAVTNVEIADLTCDANYTNGTFTQHGIDLDGERLAVRRVRVIHTAHFS